MLAGPEPELLKMPDPFFLFKKIEKVYISLMLFNPSSSFRASSTFRAKVSLKDGKPTYQRPAGADPTVHLTFLFLLADMNFSKKFFFLPPSKGSAQISF